MAQKINKVSNKNGQNIWKHQNMVKSINIAHLVFKLLSATGGSAPLQGAWLTDQVFAPGPHSGHSTQTPTAC